MKATSKDSTVDHGHTGNGRTTSRSAALAIYDEYLGEADLAAAPAPRPEPARPSPGPEPGVDQALESPVHDEVLAAPGPRSAVTAAEPEPAEPDVPAPDFEGQLHSWTLTDNRSAAGEPAPSAESVAPDQPAPVLRAVPAPQPAAVAMTRPAVSVLTEFDSILARPPRAKLARTGVRGAANRMGMRLAMSAAEREFEARRTRIRRPIHGTYQIAVLSVKGGVGRTTTTAALGSVFASLRADRVIAIDANPSNADLTARTVRHARRMTLRDLVGAAPTLQSYADVQGFAATTDADLEVMASPWTADVEPALSDREVRACVGTLRRHYNLIFADCAAAMHDSATTGVLATADAVVIVAASGRGGVVGAVDTIAWLQHHDLRHLLAASVIAVVQRHSPKSGVDMDPAAVGECFAGLQRPVVTVPFDKHLAEDREIDLTALAGPTRRAFEDMAAIVSDDFPTRRGTR